MVLKTTHSSGATTNGRRKGKAKKGGREWGRKLYMEEMKEGVLE